MKCTRGTRRDLEPGNVAAGDGHGSRCTPDDVFAAWMRNPDPWPLPPPLPLPWPLSWVPDPEPEPEPEQMHDALPWVPGPESVQ